MTRPTIPPGQPYPEDDDPQAASQPRFTPRQSGPQPPYEPPTYQGPVPYDGPPPPASPGPHQASSGYDPYPPPPPAARPPANGPSFTPHPPGGEERPGP